MGLIHHVYIRPVEATRTNRSQVVKNHSEGEYTWDRMTIRRPDEFQSVGHRINLPTTPTEKKHIDQTYRRTATGFIGEGLGFGVYTDHHRERQLARHRRQFLDPHREKVRPSMRKHQQDRYSLDDRFNGGAHRRVGTMSDGQVYGNDFNAVSHDIQGRLKHAFGVTENTEFDEPAFFLDSSHLLPSHPASLRYGMAVLDLDGEDSTFEVFVAGYGSSNMALRWNSTAGAFDNTAKEQHLLRPGHLSTGVGVCDMDGDGDEEIYVLNTCSLAGHGVHGDHILSRNPRNGLFSDLLSNSAIKHNHFEPTSVACIDRHGTGRYAIATASHGAPLNLFDLETAYVEENSRRSRRSVVVESSLESGFSGTAAGRSIATGLILAHSDHMDIYLGSDSEENVRDVAQNRRTLIDVGGHNLFFRNNGTAFEKVSAPCPYQPQL